MLIDKPISSLKAAYHSFFLKKSEKKGDERKMAKKKMSLIKERERRGANPRRGAAPMRGAIQISKKVG